MGSQFVLGHVEFEGPEDHVHEMQKFRAGAPERRRTNEGFAGYPDL